MDIFTNVLRKIFVKGSMHLIYERNLILLLLVGCFED